MNLHISEPAAWLFGWIAFFVFATVNYWLRLHYGNKPQR